MTGWTRTSEAEAYRQSLALLRRHWGSADAGARRNLAADLCAVYLDWGLLDRAEAWLKVCRRLSEDEGPGDRRGDLLSARLLVARGDAAAAVPYLERAEAAAPAETGPARAVLAAEVALAVRPQDGYAALERSLRLLRPQRHLPSAGGLLLRKVQWLRAAGRTAEVPSALRKALATAQESGDLTLLLRVRLEAAGAAGRTKACTLASEALETAAAEGVPSAEAEAAGLLSRWAAKPAQALEWFRRSAAASDQAAARQELWDREARDADRALLEEVETEGRAWDSRLLASVAEALTRPSGLAAALDAVYPPLRRLLPADIFGVALWLPDRRALDYALFIEDGVRTRVGTIPVDSPRSLGAWCFREGRPVRINDIDREYGLYLKELTRLAEHQPKSMLFLPLTAQGTTWGIATVQAFARQAYGPEELARFSVVAGLLALRIYGLDRSLAGPDAEASRA